MSRNINDDMNNPNLFQEFKPGHYCYENNDVGGKAAMGSLKLVGKKNIVRDGKSQGEAGGDMRRGKDHEWGADDGGHLVGARFGGASGAKNLTAQSMNLNRGSYKRMETKWQNHLKADDKVFVYIETNDQNRPDVYMGYAIYETPDGKRDYDTFYFNNESRYLQEKWEQELEELEREAPAGFENEDGNYYLGIVEPIPPGKSEVQYPAHDFFPDESEEEVPEEQSEFLGHLSEAAEEEEQDYMGHAGEENMEDGQATDASNAESYEREDNGEISEGME